MPRSARSEADIDAIDGDAEYQMDVSRDGGRTWEAVNATQCGGAAQAAIDNAAVHGRNYVRNGPVVIVNGGHGTLWRHCPTR
jgi:hypothetical protein